MDRRAADAWRFFAQGGAGWQARLGQKKTLAADILLDAICLDPLAEPFLLARSDLLLKDHGRLLDRLLKRFQHIATAPRDGSKVLADALNADPTFTLYIESQFRTPVFARWPAIARFLHTHRDRVAGLVLPTVAALCEKWLTSFPVTFASGEPIPFRKEFAELALATARALFVHANTDPYALVPIITRTVREMAADQPVERAATLEDVRAEVLAPDRLNAIA